MRGAARCFALALGTRLAVVAWATGNVPPAADGTFYDRIGQRIAEGHGYTWLWPDGVVTPAGHYPIGYPAIVGAAYAIAYAAPWAAMIANALFGAAAAAAVFTLANAASPITSPNGGAASPHGGAASPHGGAASPHGGAASPHGGAASPHGGAASPNGGAASPNGGAASPNGGVASPNGGAASPRPSASRAAWVAGVLVAIHPGLVAYTPALMSEGVTAALVTLGAAVAAGSAAIRSPDPDPARTARRWRARAFARALATGALLGLAALVRPPSILLAPAFGWLALREAPRAAKLLAAAAALAAALAVCAPWTLRNCRVMGRCALVSYNAGWNLAIGADPEARGTWAPLKVPDACRTVFDEAEKDACFGREAARAIAADPAAFARLAPLKLAATFNYCGAAPWYLHESNPAFFPYESKVALGAIETIFERLVLLAALAWAARIPRLARRARKRVGAWRSGERAGLSSLFGPDLGRGALFAVSAIAASSTPAWIAVLGLVVLLFARGPDDHAEPARHRVRVLPAAAAWTLLSLVAVHSVFFGAGRYSLVAMPLVTAVAALLVPEREHSRSNGNIPAPTGTSSRE